MVEVGVIILIVMALLFYKEMFSPDNNIKVAILKRGLRYTDKVNRKINLEVPFVINERLSVKDYISYLFRFRERELNTMALVSMVSGFPLQAKVIIDLVMAKNGRSDFVFFEQNFIKEMNIIIGKKRYQKYLDPMDEMITNNSPEYFQMIFDLWEEKGITIEKKVES